MPQAQTDTSTIGDLASLAVQHVNGASAQLTNNNANQLALVPSIPTTKKTVRKEYRNKKVTTRNPVNSPNRLTGEGVEITLTISKKDYYLLEVLKDSTEELSVESLINKILKTKLKNFGLSILTSEIVNELKELAD